MTAATEPKTIAPLPTPPARETFASRLGTVMTIVGVAIGLGNVWRFPYMVGKFGGAAFVLFYIVVSVVIGVPALMAEFALGRSTRRGPVGAFAAAGLPFGTFVGWFFFVVVTTFVSAAHKSRVRPSHSVIAAVASVGMRLNRMQRLIEGAKKEGALSYYTSLVAEDTLPVIEAFRSKYGIDVQVWRGSTEAIVQRALAESRAGRCPADASVWGRHMLSAPCSGCSPSSAGSTLQAINPALVRHGGRRVFCSWFGPRRSSPSTSSRAFHFWAKG